MISKIPSVYSIKNFGYSVREIKTSHKDGLMVSFCGFKSYWVCVKHWKKNEKEKLDNDHGRIYNFSSQLVLFFRIYRYVKIVNFLDG
jgi:hypothetical protein